MLLIREVFHCKPGRARSSTALLFRGTTLAATP